MTLAEIIAIEPFAWSEIGTAIVCGTMIGLERQLRGKPVGIRTSSLIILGTYIFLVLSMTFQNESTDPTRIIGQVVTGIGFLGAGVMLSRDGVILGVTSAATIWSLAAIGISIHIAGEFVAFKLSLVVVGILYLVDELESYSSVFTRGVHVRYNTWLTKVYPQAKKKEERERNERQG